ncbi:MAG: Ig domain-containing protein, partial [Candidatus Methanomethylophilaceae archaeon]|nr:Ig domain-containing protein [Candidatus Methanomethylophilaceae archaeon]
MMKKTGVMVLALVAVLACSLAMVSEPADAVDRDIQLSIGTVNSQPGATSVAVDLTIDKNVGFFGTQISIDYDSHLTLTSVVPNSIIDVTYSIGNGTCDIYLESKELADSTAVGTVLTLYFTVSSSATDEMPIAFDKVTMYNYDEIELFPLTVDGKIVIGEGSIPVTGVTLDKREATLDIGESITLTPVVAPSNATNKNVTWSSTDSSVATVSNG